MLVVDIMCGVGESYIYRLLSHLLLVLTSDLEWIGQIQILGIIISGLDVTCVVIQFFHTTCILCDNMFVSHRLQGEDG